MPRHYTDDEKRLVIDRLIANNGDVALTAAETHINDRTIHRWRNQYRPALTTLTTLPTNHSSSSTLPPETTEAFKILHDKLLALANTLSYRIDEAIDEAPLNQRVTALTQLISSISKLAAMLPAEEIEYVYEYEVEHHVEKTEDLEENSQAETEDQAATPAYQSEESAG